jgi:hypothetical protein
MIDHTLLEQRRLAFIEGRDGNQAALQFAVDTLAIYRQCLWHDGRRPLTNLFGNVIQEGRKQHHAALRQYRRGFVQSCCVFREYIRKELK